MMTFTVTWVSPNYEAALDDEAEWPPHPGRLFCALVSVADGEADYAALRWLEGLPPPDVHVPDAQEGAVLRSYVPTNQTGETKSNRVARTSGERRWHRTHMASRTVAFTWTIEAEQGHLDVLRRLARRVPYLGRSTVPCTVTCEPVPFEGIGSNMYRPAHGGRHRLRVPYPGHLDALRQAYQAGQFARTVDHWDFYELSGEERAVPDRPEPERAVYPDLVTLAFRPGIRLDGRLVLRVTTAFKAALLERLGGEHGKGELALLHGHHDGQHRQSAVIALPFVGYPHATGDLLGVGIALSPDLPSLVRRSLLRLLGLDQDHPRLDTLVVPGLASIDLVHPDSRLTVQPERWTAPSCEWVSALPVVLDRYPGNEDEAKEFVKLGCMFAGYPEPKEVDLLSVSAAAGALWLRRSDLRRKDDPPRPAMHCRLRFDRAVPGPVLVGRLRHLGLGLFIPERSEGEQGR